MFLFFSLGSQRPSEKRLVAGQSLILVNPYTAFEEGTRQNRFLVPHSLSIRDGPLEKL